MCEERKNCPKCGKDMDIHRVIKNRKGKDVCSKYMPKYCSQECSGTKKIRVNINCKHCDTNFYPNSTKQIYCNQQCAGLANRNYDKGVKRTVVHKYNKKIKYCKRCNKELGLYKRTYCSYECEAKYLMERYSLFCQKCNSEFKSSSPKGKYCSSCRPRGNKERKIIQCQLCNNDTTGLKYCKPCARKVISDKFKKFSDNNHKKFKDSGIKIKRILISMKGGGCQNCGYNKCHRGLVFHHRDPLKKSKELNSFALITMKWTSILEEFDKCDLLCQNCHLSVHKNRGKDTTGYSKHIKKKYYNAKMGAIKYKGGKCMLCSTLFNESNQHIASFHHVHTKDKINNITSMLCSGYSNEEIILELDKCDLLCMNCHMEEEERVYRESLKDTDVGDCKQT